MKKSLVSLLATTILILASSLTLSKNINQDAISTSNLWEINLSYHQNKSYDEIRRSNDYSNLKANFKQLKWHAENWGLSFAPIYGFVFYGDFIKFNNRVVESINNIWKKITLISDESILTPKSGWEIFQGVSLGFFSLPGAAAELKDSFWKWINPAYEEITSLVSKN